MIKSKIPQMILTIMLMGFSIHTFSTSNTYLMNSSSKETIGLLVLMTAKQGKEQGVKEFLLSGLPLVNEEPATESWYAFQIDDRTFGIFDTFSQEEGRQAHLQGEVAKALLANAEVLLENFEVSESIQPIDLLATKLTKGDENKGLLVMMKAREGKAAQVEEFLLGGKDLVAGEPKTISWYAIQLSNDTYAIFDTFAENAGREAHLNGKVAAALMENAPQILEDFSAQAIQTIDILASK